MESRAAALSEEDAAGAVRRSGRQDKWWPTGPDCLSTMLSLDGTKLMNYGSVRFGCNTPPPPPIFLFLFSPPMLVPIFPVLILLPLPVADVIVASEGHLNTLTASGEVNEIPTTFPLGSSVSLAMSPRHDVLYLGDSSHSNASVLKLDVASGDVHPVVPSKFIKSLYRYSE